MNYRRTDSWVKGLRAELAFEDYVLSMGWSIEKSPSSEDRARHIDYYVSNPVLKKKISFDVKKSSSSEEIWIEHTNVKGNTGWLRGESDCIAFYLDDTDRRFLVVDRDELLDFWNSVIDDNVTDKKKEAYLRAYQRKGRNDLIAKITEEDLKSLVTTRTWEVLV